MGVALNVNDAVPGAERLVRSTDVIEGGGYLLVVLGMLVLQNQGGCGLDGA